MLFELIQKGNRYTLESRPKPHSFESLSQNSDSVFLRTSYQKIYLPNECRYDPRNHIDDKVLEMYYNTKVLQEKDTHPVGSVFNVLVYKAGKLLEDFPGYSMLNTATSEVQQDHFDVTDAFFNSFRVSLKGMEAFNFFNRYNMVKEDFVTSVVSAYRK